MNAIDCPACGKSGLTVEACPRCGCDLSSLHEILRSAAWHLGLAADSLRSQQWQSALHHAAISWRLHHSCHSARLAFLAASATGHSLMAGWWHERGREHE